MSTEREYFSRLANWIAVQCGRPWTFLGAVAVVLVWAATGPTFGYSDTWQLVINTGTTIITFLMVFLIQHTQNRDSAALHLKLDELIRANKDARDALLDLENLSDEQLNRMKAQFARISKFGTALNEVHAARDDLHEPERDIGAAEQKLEEAASHH